ncbi:hypothetical protein MKX01_007485 [Papaver californicum]|nr:hypothetical protein MKX01_007485 [Papaver californicum]
MNFHIYVSAINGDEELQLSHLYFVLPLSRINQPMQAEDLLTLAKRLCSFVLFVTNRMENMRVANSKSVGNGSGGGGNCQVVVVG